MFRKVTINLLAVVFVVLLAVVVLVQVIDSQKGNRTFKSDLVEVVAEDVNILELYPKAAGGKLIKLIKQNEEWKVESEGKTFNADQSIPGRMISELNNMKPKSVAATSKERWEQFEVTDSLGTRVKLFNGPDLLADVIIGKFSFSQPRNMTSYIRLTEDKEVYGVEGMLGMSFNRNLDSFRDRTVIKSNKNDWIKLSFSYPADSSFVLEKKGEKWMIGEMETDSASVVQYFNAIANLNEGSFTSEKPVIAPTHRLTIEGNNMMQKIEITGYFESEEKFVLESNLNPNTFFDNSVTSKKVFVSVMEFL